MKSLEHKTSTASEAANDNAESACVPSCSCARAVEMLVEEISNMRSEIRALTEARSVSVQKVLSVDQVAESLGCERTRVFDLLREGRLERAPQRLGRKTAILASSVNALLTPAPRPEPKKKGRPRKPENAPAFDLQAELAKLG